MQGIDGLSPCITSTAEKWGLERRPWFHTGQLQRRWSADANVSSSSAWLCCNGCKYSTQSDQALKRYVCLNSSLSRSSLRMPWHSIHNRFTLILLAIHCFPQKIKRINEGNHSLWERSEHVKQNRELSLLIKSLWYSCENPKYDLLTPQIQKNCLLPWFVNSSNGQMPSVCQRYMEIWRQHSSARGKLLFYQTTSVSIIDSKTNNTPTETLLGWV